MNLEKFTDRAKGFLQAAQTVALRLNHQRIGAEHVLKALLEALNRNRRYIRGLVAPKLEMKFTPELRFIHDESFDAALSMNRLFDNPVVQRDLSAPSDDDDQGEDR